MTGKYCSYCGQKKFDESSLSVVHFFKNGLKEFTHFDFKIFRDVWSLVSRPGLLTQEFMKGRIASHVKPVTLFIWINIFFFLFGYKAFLPQNKFFAGDAYVSGIQQKSLAKAASKNIPEDTAILNFNARLTGFQKSMFFVLIPAFALLFWLMFLTFRNQYYISHLVYSIHYWCFLFIWFALAPALANLLNNLVQLITGKMIFRQYDGLPFFAITLLGILPYSYIALKRIHKHPVWITALLTLGAFVITILVRHLGIAATYWLAYLLI